MRRPPPSRRLRPQASACACAIGLVVFGIGQRLEHRRAATGNQIDQPVLRHAEGGREFGPVLHRHADRGACPRIDKAPARPEALRDHRGGAGDIGDGEAYRGDGAFLTFGQRLQDALIRPAVDAGIGA